MKDVLGEALTDYHREGSAAKLWVNNRYGLKEEMPVKVYFRDAEEMPELEWIALQHCRGKILDVGAGAGSHALVLQRMGLDVMALDFSPKAAAVMRARGVEKVVVGDFFTLGDDGGAAPDEKGGLTEAGSTVGAGGGIAASGSGSGGPAGGFDILLLLMNGIGLAGTISGLRLFLARARTLLRPGGRLVFDSSDIAYLYEGQLPAGGPYYGEILYQYQYKRQKSEWFNWLFIDRKTLAAVATEEGWKMELLYEDKWGQYLVSFQMGDFLLLKK
jgi:SAM-dependent methyltransferase